MKFAIIENDEVINIVVAEAPLSSNWIEDDGNAKIGSHWDGVNFIAQPEPTPTVTFISVSPRQIRQALTAKGLRDAVESAVAAGDQHLKDWWEFSSAFERNHPEVIAMAQALSVTDSKLDDLWRLAESL